MTTQHTWRGVFPVVPTIFDEAGRLDLDGQRRAV
ncbi:MAG TPA: dihydrodipicolinate synthase family protein, partial [Paraburkholderia sp.]